jgi:F-type H+-transporting ATPase subunit delta
MAVDERVARRYAAAIFSIALQDDVVTGVEDDLSAIAECMEEGESFRATMFSPEISRDGKIELCEKIFGDRINALTMEAMRLILRKGREPEIVAIRDAFTVLRRRQEGVLFATISSSELLTDKQQSEITTRLESTTGKQVEVKFETDPTLIGGVKATFEDTVLDGSLKGGLAALRDRLYHDLLKQA